MIQNITYLDYYQDVSLPWFSLMAMVFYEVQNVCIIQSYNLDHELKID